MAKVYFGIPGVNDHTEGLEHKDEIPIDEFLKNRDSTPKELIDLRSQFFNQKDRIRKTVRIPFEGGHLVAKRNPSIFRKSDEPEIAFYPDNTEFNIANAQNLKDLEGLQQVFTTVGGVAAALANTRSTGSHVVLQKGNVKQKVPITQGGKTFLQQKSSNKYKSQFQKVDESLNIQDLTNVTPGLLQSAVAKVTGNTVKATLPKYSSGAVVQTSEGTFYRPTERLASVFQIDANASLLKDASMTTWDGVNRVGPDSKYVDPNDTYYTPFGPYALKPKSTETKVPTLKQDLNRVVFKKNATRESVYKVLDTEPSRYLNSEHMKYNIDDILDQGFAKPLGYRQRAGTGYTGKLPGIIRERDRLARIPEKERSAGFDRDPLKNPQKKVKDNFRSLNDLFSQNILTKYKDIFKIKRGDIKNALIEFKVGDKEWHHALFGNKEGGRLFLNEIGQDPVIAINLMAKLQELNLPTSGVVENLALIEKAEGPAGKGHNKLHNVYRDLGLEQGGILDISDLFDAVAAAYLAGDKSAVNHLFTLLEVYAERTAPYMSEKTKQYGGKMLKDTGVEELQTVKDYDSQASKGLETEQL